MSSRPWQPRPGIGPLSQTSDANVTLVVSAAEDEACGETQFLLMPQKIGYGGQVRMDYTGQHEIPPFFPTQGYSEHQLITPQEMVYPDTLGGSTSFSSQGIGYSGMPVQSGYGSRQWSGPASQQWSGSGSLQWSGSGYRQQSGPGYRQQSGPGQSCRRSQQTRSSVVSVQPQSSAGSQQAQSSGRGLQKQENKQRKDNDQFLEEFQKTIGTSQGKLTLQIKVPKYVEETNLEHMFQNGFGYQKIGDYGYIDFKTTGEAFGARDIWKRPEKIARVEKDKDNKTKLIIKKAYEVELMPVGVAEKRKREAKAAAIRIGGKGGRVGRNSKKTQSTWIHQSLVTEEFGWCTVEEFSLKDNKWFSKAFQFKAAAKHGSVSPDLVLCEASDIGNIVFSSLLRFLFEGHSAGRTYEGKLKLENLIISQKLMLCAIIKETSELSDPHHVLGDVSSLVSSLLPLYTVNGKLPAYYDHMVEMSKGAPTSIIAEKLAMFQKEMLEQCCFLPFEVRASLVQEAHASNRNLGDAEMKVYDESAPIHLEDYMIIHKVDKLLDVVVSAGKGLEPKFASEGGHMRHLVEHAPDKLNKILHFPLIERDMLMAHYYKRYLPEFVKLMFAQRDKQPWLNVLCESYERAILVKMTIPRACIPLSLEVRAAEEEGDGLVQPEDGNEADEGEGDDLVQQEHGKEEVQDGDSNEEYKMQHGDVEGMEDKADREAMEREPQGGAQSPASVIPSATLSPAAASDSSAS